jgi:hypothetical protein
VTGADRDGHGSNRFNLAGIAASPAQALKRGGERWIAQPLGARLNLRPPFETEFDAA